MSTYVFEQEWQRERERLESLEQTYDANTIGLLNARGLAAGWTCLEFGAGAGSIARWLADQVGPDGRVVAVDLDPRFLADHGRANLEVRAHDILTGPLEDRAFDLVHGRAVLEHIPGRVEALDRLVNALRPGGWLVAEDFHFDAVMAPAMVSLGDGGEFAEVYARGLAAVAGVFRATGADPGYGAKLPAALRAAGLVDVGAQFYAPVLRSDGPTGWVYLSVASTREPILKAGLMAAEEHARALELIAAGATYVPPVMVSAWGRRPAE